MPARKTRVVRSIRCGIGLLAGGCGGDATSPANVATIELTPASGAVMVHNNGQIHLPRNGRVYLRAVPRGTNGAIVKGATLSWSASDPTAVLIYDTGRDGDAWTAAVAGERIGGPVIVTAHSGQATASASISVFPYSISIQGASSGLPIGTTAQLTVQAYGGDGNEAAGSYDIAWTSETPTIASVSTTGTVTALAPGTATIAATVIGVIGTRSLPVGYISPFDGAWFGSPSARLDVLFGVVRSLSLGNLSAPLSTGGSCFWASHGFTVNATITNGAFSGNGISGVFTDATHVTGTYPSFTLTGAACNALGTASFAAGSFSATKQ